MLQPGLAALNPAPWLGRPGGWWRLALVALSYYVTALLGLSIPYLGTFVTLVWMPTGISVAALLRWGPGLWPAVAVGAFFASLHGGGAPPPLAAMLTVGNTLAPLAAVALLRRLRFCPGFERRRDVLLLVVFGAALPMTISASGGVLSLALHGLVPADRWLGAWFYWWMGDAVGVLVGGAPLMALSTPALRALARAGRVETLAISLAVVATGVLLFLAPDADNLLGDEHAVESALLFLPFVLLVWSVMRTGVLAASSQALVFSALAAAGTALGRGPFHAGTPHQGLLMLWAFLVACVLVVLLLAALVAELQARQRLSDALIEHSGIAMLFVRPPGVIVRANPAADALLGTATGGRRDASKVLPLPAPLRPLADREGVETVAWSGGPHPEQLFEVTSMRLPDDLDGPLRCLVLRDVTEQARAAKALADNEARLTLALSAGRMGAWKWDAVHDRSEWDSASYAMYGVDPSEPASFARLLQQVHPDDREALKREVAGAGRQGGDLDVEFRVVHADGRVRHLVGRGRGESGPDGQLRGMAGVSFDVTAEREAKQAWIAAEAADRANQAKSRFLSHMSHELRTPLNAVLGFAQLLALDDALGSSQRDNVHRIVVAGRHLLAMIDDVLDLAHIESGGVRLVVQPVPVRSALEDALEMQRLSAQERQVRLEIDDADLGVDDVATTGRLRVLADPLRLQQVLANLISNAIKYNHRGGRVVLSSERRGGEVHLRVRDTGPGLTGAQRAQLFEPFNRLGAERSGVEGTGIGLTVARGLAERMEGRIEVHSEPGRGSAFTLVLKAAQDASRRSSA